MHYFISAIPFLFLFYVPTATASFDDDDALFLAFVKGKPNFEKFCKELDENGKLEMGKPENGNSSTSLKSDQKKDHLTQKYEAHLGVLYLMRENWKCANIVKKIKLLEKNYVQHEKKECEKFRKYLDILYEYLFRVHLEAADQTLSQQLPAVKPQFEFYLNSEIPLKTLIQIVQGLSNISDFFFDKNSSLSGYKFNEKFTFVEQTKLSNEAELSPVNANVIQRLKNLKTEHTNREQFDKKLEQMLMNTKEKADSGLVSYEHQEKFNIFLDSSFYGKVRQ